MVGTKAQAVSTTAGSPRAGSDSHGTRGASASVGRFGGGGLLGALAKGPLASNAAEPAGDVVQKSEVVQKSGEDLTGTINRVTFAAPHPMSTYGAGPDARTNATWVPGAADHAAAYSMNTAPVVSGTAALNNAPPTCSTAQVRAKANGAIVGIGAANLTGNALTIPSVQLTLPTANQLNRVVYNLEWEASADGSSWQTLGTSGGHLLYWLNGAPIGAGAQSMAVSRATLYASVNPGDPVTAIRQGIHNAVTYNGAVAANGNLLDLLNGGTALCANFADLMGILVNAVGIPAQSVMFFGGFTEGGEPIWVGAGGGGGYPPMTLTHVNPGNYDFSYHALCSVNGADHDPALDRTDVEGQALFSGAQIKVAELSTSDLPEAHANAPYQAQIERIPKTVAVTRSAYPSNWGNILTVVLPLGTTAGHASGLWSVSGLPPGVTVNPTTGELTGTPTAAGDYDLTINLQVYTFNNTVMTTLRVV